jgi:hypothetical protein
MQAILNRSFITFNQGPSESDCEQLRNCGLFMWHFYYST